MWKGKKLQPLGQCWGRLLGFSCCSGLSFRLLGLSSQRLGLSFQLLETYFQFLDRLFSLQRPIFRFLGRLFNFWVCWALLSAFGASFSAVDLLGGDGKVVFTQGKNRKAKGAETVGHLEVSEFQLEKL